MRSILVRAFAAAFLGSVLLSSAPGVGAQVRGRVLEVDDLFALARVGDPRVSPDGLWVAYTVTRADLEENRSETRIWMIHRDGGDPIPMTASGSSARRPRWSPDGRLLAFLAARNGDETQVWALDRNGGEARPITAVEQGVSSYEWSPDARRLALTIRDPAPDSTGAEGAGGDEDDEPPPPWVIRRLQFKRDDVGYLDERRTHVWVYDLDEESLRQVTFGPWDDSDPVWSPDGRRIAFVSNRTEDPDANDNTDLWVVEPASPDPAATLRKVTTNPGADRSPAWSPDGSRIAYVTGLRPDLIWYATDHLALVSAEGGVPRVLTEPLDRNARDPIFTDDGQEVLFLLEDAGAVHLASVSLSDGTIRRPVTGERELTAFHRGPGGMVAALVSEPHLPGEVFLHDAAGTRRLTSTNDGHLAGIRLADVEKVGFRSRDGTRIEGFVFKPVGFREGTRYPTLLRIHGGPVSQYDFGFNFESQLFAANGYLVVNVNPRGSSGYGQDFSLAIWRDWGNLDYEDVMAGVDHVIERGWADPGRLGVGGWSYGGILTNYVITKTDRFRAAITGASEVLYVANYGHDHYQLQWELELGLPWENRDVWERISPFNAVERIVTPTLVMGGEKDWNVPILNSEQLYQALRRLGRTTELVVYPGEHHGLRVPAYQKDRYDRYLDWYGRFLGVGVEDAAGGATAAGSGDTRRPTRP